MQHIVAPVVAGDCKPRDGDSCTREREHEATRGKKGDSAKKAQRKRKESAARLLLQPAQPVPQHTGLGKVRHELARLLAAVHGLVAGGMARAARMRRRLANGQSWQKLFPSHFNERIHARLEGERRVPPRKGRRGVRHRRRSQRCIGSDWHKKRSEHHSGGCDKADERHGD